jgi:hypothetical protein
MRATRTPACAGMNGLVDPARAGADNLQARPRSDLEQLCAALVCCKPARALQIAEATSVLLKSSPLKRSASPFALASA